MGKKTEQLYDAMYDDDYYTTAYDYAYDDTEEYTPISTNRAEKQEKQLSQRARKEQERKDRDAKRQAKNNQPKTTQKAQSGMPTEPISTVPVRSYCNKCKESVNGTLLGYFWQPHADLYIPFMEYACRNCGHAGQRSAMACALSPAEFEHVYFK